MRPDWFLPVLILLLALVFLALWLRLRGRRRAEQVGAAHARDPDAAERPVGEEKPKAGPAPEAESALDVPPEILAVREELARIRAEEDAEAAGEPASGERPHGDPAEAGTPGAAAKDTPPQAAPETVPETGLGPDEKDPPGEDEASTASAVLEPAAARAPEDPPIIVESAPEALDGATDAYDSEGRIILAIAMGDVIVTTKMPRHIRLAVTRQWPLPVVQGFNPGTERLVLLYDGPEATDIVILPTVENTWQISLGGRPVVQVDCADGPEALGRALRVNPDESEAG